MVLQKQFGEVHAPILIALDTQDIKLRIQDHEGIPKDHQRLLFDGNQLVDSHVLSVYKVPNEATLQLLYRLYPTQHGLPTIVVKSWTGDVMRINAESGDTILVRCVIFKDSCWG